MSDERPTARREDSAEDDGWVDFQGKRQLFDQRDPAISIQSKGAFSFNRQAFAALGEPEKVVFRYNTKRRAIAIRSAQPGELNAYTVKKQQNADSYVVGARAFLLYIEYPYLGEVHPFRPKVENGMLVINLDEVNENGASEA